MESHLIQEAYHIVSLDSGKKALAYVEQNEPDVLLLDVMMPGMDGFEVCRRLKSDKKNQHIPIILITALDGKEQIARGLDAGADDFLSKPVSGLELRARLRSMLRIKHQYDELQATLCLREKLSNMIVHDMRNPLAVARLYSQILKRTVSDPAIRKRIDSIDTAVSRLDSFVNDLLLQAKMESDQLILNRTSIDVNQLIVGAQKSYSSLAQNKNLSLVLDLPAHALELSLDANLFQRVLDNLVGNAVKFSPNNSTITLRVRTPSADGTATRIQVLDEGPGIPKEYQEAIFDPYQIVGLIEQNVPQIGLGLTFCNMVVEAHGGRLFVDENEPQGSIFTVEL